MTGPMALLRFECDVADIEGLDHPMLLKRRVLRRDTGCPAVPLLSKRSMGAQQSTYAGNAGLREKM